MSQAAHTFIIRLSKLPRHSWRSDLHVWRWAGILLLFALLWWGYTFSSQPIDLVINGKPRQIRTHHLTVTAIVKELGIQLQPEDMITPAPQSTLSTGQTLTIQLARPVTVQADGQSWQQLTHAQTVEALLTSLGLSLNPRDEIFIAGQQVSAQAEIPDIAPLPSKDRLKRLLAVTTPRGTIATSRPQPVEISVQRAVPVTVHDHKMGTTFYTARATVAEVLAEQNISLLEEDRISPALDMTVSAGTQIFIQRATPVTLMVDGQIINARSHGKTVGQVLDAAGIALMGQDYVTPAPEEGLIANQTIEVIRVHEAFEIEEEHIAFETQWIPDETMELDRHEVRQQGNTGVIKSRTRVRYENDKVVLRQFEDEWLDQQPHDRIVAYGTNIVIRTLNTPNGPIEYWRRVPMLTTAYSAVTSGKAPDHPLYGITRSGLEAGHGVVAVDTSVIPLMTKLYIPDYGSAVAGDTGGRIWGKHIDLGFDEVPPIMWEWRDIYILTPVPATGKIRYVLPQWPQR